jgi:hypothetical protein
MTDNRRSIRGRHVVGAFVLAVLALSAPFALPVANVPEASNTGASVHAKNSDTPGWILELETRNARQSPVTMENGQPSYWI